MLLTIRKQKDFDPSESIFHLSILEYTFLIKKEEGFLSFSFCKNKIIEFAYINLSKTKNTYWSDDEDEIFRIGFNN